MAYLQGFTEAHLVGQYACVVRDANMGHQLARANSSCCPKLESRTTHRSGHGGRACREPLPTLSVLQPWRVVLQALSPVFC